MSGRARSIEHEDEEVASFPAALPPPEGAGGRTGHPALGRGKDPACLSSSSRARRALERVARRLCPQGCHHGQQLCPQLAWMRRQCHLLGPQNGVLYTDVRLGTPAPCSSLVPRQNGCKGQGETAPMRSGETSPKHPQCSKCCCRCLFRAQLLGMVSPDPKGPMP